MNTILHLFLLGLLSISLIFVLGRVLNYLTKTNSDFKNMALVVMSLTTAFALFKSNFHSYLWILLILLVYAVFRLKKIEKEHSKTVNPFGQNFINQLVQLVFYYSFSFILLNIQILAQDSAYINLHPDFSLYAGISEILTTTGIENNQIDIALNNQKSFSFYHYFELWFNGLLSEIFSITHLKSLMFVMLPLISAIMLKGLFELQHNYFSKYSLITSKWKYILPLAIFFLFPFTITFRWIFSLGSSFEPWNASIAISMSIKWVIVLTALIYLFLDYEKNKLQNTALIACFMAVVYPTTMIATLPSLIIWLTLFRKKLPRIAWLDILVPTIFIAFVMWYLISFNHSLNINSTFEIPSTLSMIKDYFIDKKSNLILFVKEPVLRTIYIAIGFLPLLTLLFFKRKSIKAIVQKHYPLVGLFTIIYVLSIFGVVLLDFSKDGDQIHRNIFYPLYILILYFGLIYLIKDENKKLSILASVLLIISVSLNMIGLFFKITNTPVIKTVNYNTILENLEGIDVGDEIAYIVDNDYFSNSSNKNFYFEIPAQNIRFENSKYFPHLLSIDRIKMESMRDKFYAGRKYISGKFLNKVVIDNMSYEQIFNNDDNLKFIIVENTAPEKKNAEELFSVDYIGEIDGFSYYKKK